MKSLNVSLRLAAVAIATTGVASAVELDQRALAAWDEYVKIADSDIDRRMEAGRPFLWFDDLPHQQNLAQMSEIVVIPRTGHGTRNVPRGLIHDWIGTVFIPNAKIDRVLAVARDYANYNDYYKPFVAKSKIIRCSAMGQDVSMVWLNHALLRTIAIESELSSRDYVIGDDKVYNVALVKRLQEIGDFGQRGEHLLPAGGGNGFLWGVHSITKYEQRDGGTYIEFEGMALTRDIPVGIRWLVKPIVEELSRMSVTTFLRKTRDAVNANPVPSGPSGPCPMVVSQGKPSP